MRKRSIVFVMYTLLLSVLILSNERSAYANDSDSDYEWDDNMDGTVTIIKYKGASKNVIIPDELDDKAVTSIGDFAFSNNNLTSVTLPDGLTSIGASAFYNNNLTSVTLPDGLTSIGDFAFSNNNLTSVTLPDGLTSIGLAAFQSNNLTGVTLPGSLTSIGDFAFNLNNLTSVILPDGLTSIGVAAFQSNNLTGVTLPGSLTSIGNFAFNFNNLTSVILPDGLTSIGSSAFARNQLKSVILPNELTSISGYAFSDNNLTSVILPDSLTSISGEAFWYNPLMSVKMTSNISFTSDNALSRLRKAGHVFDGWYTDSAFMIEWDKAPADVTLYAKWTVGDYEWTDNKDGVGNPNGTVTITNYVGTSKDVVIPDKLGGKIVTGIGNSAFSGNAFNGDGLTSVILPDSVTSIGYGAFVNNPLMSVKLTSNINNVLHSVLSPLRKAGHVFDGWYTDSAFTMEWDGRPADVTLYAKWIVDKYTVTFDSQGGSTVDSVKADYATLINAPTEPTKSGHTFVGWYTDTALTTLWDFSVDTVQEDMTLYAKWQHTVAFESTGGNAVANVLVDSNALLIPPSIPIQSGHTFVDWYTDTALTMPWNFSVDTVQENMTLYAKWTVNEYTIMFDSQGGSAVQDVVADYSTKISAPTEPTKLGHTFASWYTDAALTTPWDFSVGIVQRDMTLYAKWTANKHTITFDSQGGNSVPDVVAAYGTKINVPKPPTRSGRTFVGWYTDMAFTTPWDFAVDIVEEDITLYAKWKVKPMPSPLDIQATMTVDKALTEEQLDGGTIIVDVSDTNFIMSLIPEYFKLQNAPKGLTIRKVKRISAWQVELTLAFDGKHLEQNYDLGLMIHGAALTNGFNITTNNSLRIQKGEIPYKIITKEGTFEPTKMWTVKLSNKVDASTVQDALYIVDAEGNRIPTIFTSEGNYIFIHPPTENYAEGTYTLYITSKLKNKNGTNLKEPIKMTFIIETIEEPEQEETYKTIIEEATFPSDKAWTIDLVMDIDLATLENGVFMEDENGTIIPVTFTSDGTNLIVQAPVEGYEAGTYRLYITSEVKDTNGTNLKEPIQMIFTVE